MKEHETVIARALLDELTISEIEYLEMKHQYFKREHHLPAAPTFLNRVQIAEPLDQAMLDEAFRGVDWLYPHHKMMISDLLLGKRQCIDPIVREHIAGLTATGKVKLCCILVAIAWAEYEQDRAGYIRNFWYEHHARMKRLLQDVGEKSSYGAWQNPVPRVDMILSEEYRKHADNPGASALINALLEQYRNYLRDIQQSTGFEADSIQNVSKMYYLLARDDDPRGDPHQERRLQLIIEMAIRIAFTCDINSEDETQVFVRWNHGNMDCTELAAIQMQLNMMRRQALAIQQWVRSENFVATQIPTLWNYIGRKYHEEYFDIERFLGEFMTEKQRNWLPKRDIERAKERLNQHIRKLFRNKTIQEIREFTIDDTTWPVCDVDGNVEPNKTGQPDSPTELALAATKKFFGMFDKLELEEIRDSASLLEQIRGELERMHVIPNQVNAQSVVANNKRNEAIMREILSLQDTDDRKRKMLSILGEDETFIDDLAKETARDRKELATLIRDGTAIDDGHILSFAARYLQMKHMANEKDTEKYVVSAKLAYDVLIRRFRMSGPIVR